MSDEQPQRRDTDDLALWRARVTLVAVLEARRRSLIITPHLQDRHADTTTGECLSVFALALVLVVGGILLACDSAVAVLAPGFPHPPVILIYFAYIVALCVATCGVGALALRRWYRERR